MQISSPNPKQKSSTSQGHTSDAIKRNARIFGYVMIFLQICLSLIYGFLINVQSLQLNVGSVIITIGLAILVIAGFGLVFGYTRRLVWSGIGFTFFITALCIEVYPLINDFWTKVGLQSNNTPIDFNIDRRMFNLYLSDRQTASTSKSTTYYGNSITNALKCALSISIAFSSILGRAGQLQCLIASIFGIIGFELNRQIIQQNQGADTFGTFFIFAFGGFMGLGLGLLSFFRERKTHNQVDRASLKKYVGSQYSSLYSLFGVLIIFALFPLLSYEFDAYTRYNAHSPYSNPLCVIVAMGAGAICSITVSCLINGYIITRDITHGTISGAISVGASSLYVTNPVYAFVAGAAGGIVQVLIQNFVEKRAARTKLIISTVSWSLFGLQGLIGAGFAAGWKAIYFSMQNGLTIEALTLEFTSQFQFYGGLISAGIGLAFGLLAGVIIILVNPQKSKEYFEDAYHWFGHDGIRYNKVVEPTKQHVKPIVTEPDVKKPHEDVVSRPAPEPAFEPQPLPEDSEDIFVENLTMEDIDQFDFSENEEYIMPYAYL